MKNAETSLLIGYILLLPAIISVVLFFFTLFTGVPTLTSFDSYSSWTGNIQYSSYDGGGGGGYTSALPLYIGLLALAGAYLIRD